jgi:S-methylmethionine-dependent homocysteine/selenocysteine methylase
MKTNTTLELLAEYAEQNIAASMAQVAGSIAPTGDRVAGEIDMAYKLKLIDYPRRDVLRSQLRVIVNNRRVELREQQNARMLRTA